MLAETIWAGRTIFNRGHVRLIAVSPNHQHFIVRQQSTEVETWSDVFYALNKKTGIREWSCNCLGQKKDGTKWGCVMNNSADKSKPFCKHSLAADLLRKKEGLP